MKELLYLSHRIPYPPDKGDKIRSYNLLRRLAERWTVHLGTFVDDKDDWQYTETVSKICGETKYVRLNPTTAKIRALPGLLSGSSMTMPYYRDSELQAWVNELLERREIDCVVVFSSSMAQYVSRLRSEHRIRTVVDFCDMDSDKWRQYSAKFSGVKRWFYGREADKLRREEAEVAEACDASVFISADEAEVFCSQTSVSKSVVHTVPNGVDVEYFDPGVVFDNPFPQGTDPVVFVGAMDYWPNVDAVVWFAREVLPGLQKANPDAEFHIVGSNPSDDVRALDQQAGIHVTGRVPDVRPYLKHARCIVAPLRIARGVQNKVLEAMAMAKPIIATGAALEGISLRDGLGVKICEEGSDWITAVHQLIGDSSLHAEQPAARKHVMENYSWDASAKSLAEIVAG